MIGDSRLVSIQVVAREGRGGVQRCCGPHCDGGRINALKHAFPPDQHDGQIVDAYDVDGANWTLSIGDMGSADQRKAWLRRRQAWGRVS